MRQERKNHHGNLEQMKLSRTPETLYTVNTIMLSEINIFTLFYLRIIKFHYETMKCN